jgi:hypothetical protein
MNQQSFVVSFEEFRTIFIGIVISIAGILLEVILMAYHWATYSEGIHPVRTAGLIFIFPFGLLVLVFGLVSLIIRRHQMSSAS